MRIILYVDVLIGLPSQIPFNKIINLLLGGGIIRAGDSVDLHYAFYRHVE